LWSYSRIREKEGRRGHHTSKGRRKKKEDLERGNNPQYGSKKRNQAKLTKAKKRRYPTNGVGKTSLPALWMQAQNGKIMEKEGGEKNGKKEQVLGSQEEKQKQPKRPR